MGAAAIYLSFCASIIWGTYLTSVVRSHARDSQLHEGMVIGNFNGDFFGMFASRQFFGNLLTLALLRDGMVMENGISYSISLEGQETGFYADQRENRKFISSISKGQNVLDICCYSCGFALNAAVGGATNVLDPGRISFARQDATTFMKGIASRNESWDLVILDPPKLAPNKKESPELSSLLATREQFRLQGDNNSGFPALSYTLESQLLELMLNLATNTSNIFEFVIKMVLLYVQDSPQVMLCQ